MSPDVTLNPRSRTQRRSRALGGMAATLPGPSLSGPELAALGRRGTLDALPRRPGCGHDLRSTALERRPCRDPVTAGRRPQFQGDGVTKREGWLASRGTTLPPGRVSRGIAHPEPGQPAANNGRVQPGHLLSVPLAGLAPRALQPVREQHPCGGPELLLECRPGGEPWSADLAELVDVARGPAREREQVGHGEVVVAEQIAGQLYPRQGALARGGRRVGEDRQQRAGLRAQPSPARSNSDCRCAVVVTVRTWLLISLLRRSRVTCRSWSLS